MTGRKPLPRAVVATVALSLAALVPYYLLTLDRAGPIPRDGTTLVVGRDFLNLWMVGRAAWMPDPARLYDLATYWAAVARVLGPGYPGQQWSYPPTSLLLAAPFGLLPYLGALAAWTAVGLAAFAGALRRWTRDWRMVSLLAALPAALFGLISGQMHLLAAAALLTGLRWRAERPALAGLMFGLLTIKPQLGLFVPLLLLVERRWRVIGGGAATALALAGLTALVWGSAVWGRYLGVGVANQSLILSDPEHLAGPFMATVWMNARTAGASLALAGWLQGLASLSAAGLIVWRFRVRPDPADPLATLGALGLMAWGAPYLLSYDTLALGVAAVLAMAGAPRYRLVLLLVVLLPLVQMAAGSRGLPGPALIPLAAALTAGGVLAKRRDFRYIGGHP